jgi:hypothetical protein
MNAHMPPQTRFIHSDRVVVYELLDKATEATFAEFLVQIERARSKTAAPLGLVLIISAAFSTPSAELQQLIKEKGRKILSDAEQVHISLGGHGLWGTIQRTVLEGLALLTGGKRSRLKFHASAEEAIRQACAFTGQSAAALLAAARSAQIGALAAMPAEA